MTEYLGRFKEMQDGLEQILEASRFAYDTDAGKRLFYRQVAAQIIEENSRGTVHLQDTTPDSVIDQNYQAAIHRRNDIAKGYFHEYRTVMIQEAPESRLAKNLLSIPYVEVKDDEPHNKAVQAIQQYLVLQQYNRAFDTEQPLGGRKITQLDLLQFAQQYVLEKLREPDSAPESKYVSDNTKKIVEQAVLAVLTSSPQSIRLTTAMIEKNAKNAYEALVPDDGKKADVVRKSLLHQENEDIARQALHHALKEREE